MEEQNSIYDTETATIADTTIETGDLIKLPISRQRTLGPYKVIGIDETFDPRTEEQTGVKVYLDTEMGNGTNDRATLYTEGAIAFGVLEGPAAPEKATEILGVEKVEMPDEPMEASDKVKELLGDK